jgi:hypothetical protein
MLQRKRQRPSYRWGGGSSPARVRGRWGRGGEGGGAEFISQVCTNVMEHKYAFPACTSFSVHFFSLLRCFFSLFFFFFFFFFVLT